MSFVVIIISITDSNLPQVIHSHCHLLSSSLLLSPINSSLWLVICHHHLLSSLSSSSPIHSHSLLVICPLLSLSSLVFLVSGHHRCCYCHHPCRCPSYCYCPCCWHFHCGCRQLIADCHSIVVSHFNVIWSLSLYHFHLFSEPIYFFSDYFQKFIIHRRLWYAISSNYINTMNIILFKTPWNASGTGFHPTYKNSKILNFPMDDMKLEMSNCSYCCLSDHRPCL